MSSSTQDENALALSDQPTSLIYQTTLDVLAEMDSTKLDKIMNSEIVETTSHDNKPIITPSEFHDIMREKSYFQDENLKYQQEEVKTVLKKRKLGCLGQSLLVNESLSPNSTNIEPIISPAFNQKMESISNEPISRNFENYDTLTSSTENKSVDEGDSPLLPPVKKYLIVENKEEKMIKKEIKEIKLHSFDTKKNEIKFRAKIKGQKNGSSKSELVTRLDLLKSNPLTLLYYYEQNLVFNEDNCFDLEKLLKI